MGFFRKRAPTIREAPERPIPPIRTFGRGMREETPIPGGLPGVQREGLVSRGERFTPRPPPVERREAAFRVDVSPTERRGLPARYRAAQIPRRIGRAVLGGPPVERRARAFEQERLAEGAEQLRAVQEGQRLQAAEALAVGVRQRLRATGERPGLFRATEKGLIKRVARLEQAGYQVEGLSRRDIEAAERERFLEESVARRGVEAERLTALQSRQRLKAALGATGLPGFIKRTRKGLQEFQERQATLQEARAKAQIQVQKAALAQVKTRVAERGLELGDGGGLFGPGPAFVTEGVGVGLGAPRPVGLEAEGAGGGGIFGPGPAWLEGLGGGIGAPPAPQFGPPPPPGPPVPQVGPAGGREPQKGVLVRTYYRAPPGQKADTGRPKTKQELIAELARAALTEGARKK